MFYSPYEAAVWCLVSARRPPQQMMQVRDRLSQAHGQVFDLAGEQLAALPTPGQLLAIDSFPGLPGPFYSSLIVVRGTGFADVLPVGEPRALDLAGRLYQLDGPPSEAEFRTLAQPWKPLRTWAVVLIRAAAPRVLDGAGAGQAGAPAGVR